MTEWILIITMHLSAAKGIMPDVQPTIISGFSSQARCDEAGHKIARTMVVQIGSHREAQGIAGNTAKYAPHVNTKCISIGK